MTAERFEDLIDLYTQMDQAWDAVAEQYGFQCNGCEDNCCRSLFFHHTHVEKAFIRYGFDRLDPEKKRDMLTRAQDYILRTFQNPENIQSQKIMCPANEDGKCLVYRYRPMICRMHGLPHELCRPGALPMRGPGCTAGQFAQKEYIPFDRTPFYTRMARIETDFRATSGLAGKLKETVAHMLTS